jgi:hypothetical protein
MPVRRVRLAHFGCAEGLSRSRQCGVSVGLLDLQPVGGLPQVSARQCPVTAPVGRYVESDPMGLRGRSYSTYAYVRGNPISRVNRLGMVDEEDDEEVEEPPLVEQITRANIDSLVQNIRQYDPGFKYATIAPANFRYGRQDIQNLQDILAQ